jgi:hypothetical protein
MHALLQGLQGLQCKKVLTQTRLQPGSACILQRIVALLSLSVNTWKVCTFQAAIQLEGLLILCKDNAPLQISGVDVLNV